MTIRGTKFSGGLFTRRGLLKNIQRVFTNLSRELPTLFVLREQCFVTKLFANRPQQAEQNFVGFSFNRFTFFSKSLFVCVVLIFISFIFTAVASCFYRSLILIRRLYLLGIVSDCRFNFRVKLFLEINI